jgi:hypothetical protein
MSERAQTDSLAVSIKSDAHGSNNDKKGSRYTRYCEDEIALLTPIAP